RAPGVQAQAQQRRVWQRAIELEVRASLARVGAADRHPRAHARVASDRRLDRARARRRATAHERKVFTLDLTALQRALRAAWTASERATSSRPDVSRSSLWTMPARAGSPPAALPASSCDSVPSLWP